MKPSEIIKKQMQENYDHTSEEYESGPLHFTPFERAVLDYLDEQDEEPCDLL